MHAPLGKIRIQWAVNAQHMHVASKESVESDYQISSCCQASVAAIIAKKCASQVLPFILQIRILHLSAFDQ